jgi:hypothetical protein
MAGGVNPFGFSGGVIPQAVRPPKRGPQDLPSAPFGFAPPPSKMQQTLAILNEYNPLPAFERLLKSPMALGGPISEQDIADGLMVSGAVTGGSAAAPKPRNALNMGIRAYHGTYADDLDHFDSSLLGQQFDNKASRAAHWFSTNPDDAAFYGPNVYEVELDGQYKDLSSMEEMAKQARKRLVEIAERNFGKTSGDVANKVVDYVDSTHAPHFYTDVTAAHISKAKRAGYDGVRLKGGETVQDISDPGDNYAVFNPELVKIVRKLGIAGASAMLGYNILEGMDPAQAEELQRIEGNQ